MVELRAAREVGGGELLSLRVTGSAEQSVSVVLRSRLFFRIMFTNHDPVTRIFVLDLDLSSSIHCCFIEMSVINHNETTAILIAHLNWSVPPRALPCVLPSDSNCNTRSSDVEQDHLVVTVVWSPITRSWQSLDAVLME